MKAWLAANGRNRAIAASAAAVLVLVVATAVVLVLTRDTGAAAKASPSPTATATATATATSTPTNTPLASPTPVRFAGILDGVAMSESDWNSRKDLLPIAVMFDNSPDAFPHAGLDKADLVYEAFVEGGITRFMGVYWSQEADYLEPVRSARTPFVIWVDELGALYAHAGEAETDNEANAGGQIYEWGIKDLTAFGGIASNAYYRDNDRYAPHNLVTSTEALRQAASALGYAGPPAVEPWLFKADGEGTANLPDAGGIEINFQGTRYPWQLVQWHWDPATKTYLRFQFGGPHFDAQTNEQLRFKNIVVMALPSRVVDSSGHVLFEQFGSGPATVFVDGKAIEATWKKADRQARTRFYDASGKEIAFDRGPIFIEVLDQRSNVTAKASAAELLPIPVYVPPPPAPPVVPDEEDAGTPPPVSPSATASPAGSPAGSPTRAPGSPTGTTGTPVPPPPGSPTTVPDGTSSPQSSPSSSPEPGTPEPPTGPSPSPTINESPEPSASPD